jgi:hypothetical protein
MQSAKQNGETKWQNRFTKFLIRQSAKQNGETK